MNNMDMKKVVLFAICCFGLLNMKAEDVADNRWSIVADNEIVWDVTSDKIPHRDHIEMSGLKVSTVVRYGVEADGSFYLNRGMVWPMLRTVPNNTHASLMRRMGDEVLPKLLVNGRTLEGEKVQSIKLNGLMTVISNFPAGVQLERVLFPSVTLPAFCERYTLTNTSRRDILVELPHSVSKTATPAEKGVYGSYSIEVKQTGGTATLKPGESIAFAVTIEGYKAGEADFNIDIEREKSAREALIGEYSTNLVLETPSDVLNTMFKFAKIRASESIYDTKGGLMHGPGGESYYAAIWANDQAEYVNPFFPFLGYGIGNKSALNSYMHFARFMNSDYKKVPSSIIAEGDGTWGGAGDRGDAAMIAYGAARYALTRGDKQEAEQLWPLIEWCLEYSRRQINEKGVVGSDSDELEGRFPSGEANLCTSSLYYDALITSAYLGKELGKPAAQTRKYEQQAVALRKAMGEYFAATVEGYDTYQYYEGNDILRSWICIPLTVGITERKEGTIEALFSPRLWTENGLLTAAGSETFWDRSTLYAMRGVLAVGEVDRVMPYLMSYSQTRLLGDHVPYAIEAWPEGSQRHLSAESGLYCRIFTEGLFGIRPTGFDTFTITPCMPASWDTMALRHIRAFNGDIDIQVTRKGQKLQVTVLNHGKQIRQTTIAPGATVKVSL